MSTSLELAGDDLKKNEKNDLKNSSIVLTYTRVDPSLMVKEK